MTFIMLKLIGIFVPLRLSDEELEIGDHAIHGNEVYPSDVPTLGGPHAPSWQPDRGTCRRVGAQEAGKPAGLRCAHPCGRVRAGSEGQRPRLGGVAALSQPGAGCS